MRYWGSATVYHILIEGDRMYLNVLESQKILDRETLSLIYLRNQAHWKGHIGHSRHEILCRSK